MALPDSVVIREQIWSHVKEEPFNNELHRAGVKGGHWGAYAGRKRPNTGNTEETDELAEN